MAYQVFFFGTNEWTIPTLKTLAESDDFEVKAVITQPDKPSGRKQELTPSPVKIFAETLELPVLQPEKLYKNEEFLDFIRAAEPDFLIVVSYGKILPKKLLAIPRYGAINIHPSLLPKYRGPSPMQEALLKGDKETGVTIMKLDEKMDEGPIIFVKKMPIEESDNYTTLEKKVAVMASEFIVPVLKDFAEGILKPLLQNHSKATYCRKFEKKDGEINWSDETAEEINNKIRAFAVWPKTYTHWKDKMLRIIKARVENSEKMTSEKPGTILFLENKKIGIIAKKGLIIPEVVQLEGKNEISIEEFLKGYEKGLRENPTMGA